RRADDAAEPTRQQRLPLRQQVLHDRKVEAPADRGDREEGKAKRRYPRVARLGNNGHGGMVIPDNESARWHANDSGISGTQLQGNPISANSQCTLSCRRMFPTHLQLFSSEKENLLTKAGVAKASLLLSPNPG